MPKPKRRGILSHTNSDDEEYKPEVIASSKREVKDSLMEIHQEETIQEEVKEVKDSEIEKYKEEPIQQEEALVSKT